MRRHALFVIRPPTIMAITRSGVVAALTEYTSTMSSETSSLPPYLLPSPLGGKSCPYFRAKSRPADVFLPNWSRGRPAALDITIISPLQQATLQGAASTQGHALLVGEARKFSAHGAQCQSAAITFIPITFEALGGMSSLAADTIAKIGCLLG